jgi:hypothetical protein
LFGFSGYILITIIIRNKVYSKNKNRKLKQEDNLLERYIAIDNVCAWPNLTLLPDGAIAAVIFNKPTHGKTEGELECWISRDGGYLWGINGVPVPHKPNENIIHVAAGLTNDENLIVICTGIGPLPLPQIDTKVTDPVISRSMDKGRIWSQGGSIENPVAEYALVPFGNIVRNIDGVLGVCMYSYSGQLGRGIEHKFSSYFIRSYDNGKTWVEPVLISSDANETTVLSLGGHLLLAATRTLASGPLEIYSSEDFGTSWTSKGLATMPEQMPAHLLKLEDGRIMLTYGIRNKGYYGVGARMSKDGGESWSQPVFLIDFEISTDGGYPSCVQLKDGTIVTAYYSNKIPSHNRYHMGILRWKVEEFFEA